MRDGTPLAVAVTATVQGEDIHITWAASDPRSGLNTCSLEVDTGDGSPEELSTSCEGPYIYTEAEPGQTCIFHLTATDNVGNQASAEATSALPRVTKYYHHGGKRVAMRSGGQVYYLHGDHLGSTSLTTDENGEVVSLQLHHPFGTVRYSKGTLPTDFGFTGQKTIASAGLIFMNARFYHPYINRWISPDTIVPDLANPQSLNRYSYVYNRPLVYVDPDGHIAIVIPIVPIIGLAALAVFFLTLPGDTPCPNCETLEGNRVVGQAALWIAASCAVATLAVPAVGATGTVGAKTAAELAAAGACADQDCFDEASAIAETGTRAVEALSADGDPTNEARAIGDAVEGLASRAAGGTGAAYDRLTGQGLYVLKDANGVVQYVGRGDAPARAAAHALDPIKGTLDAQIIANNDLTYAEARGLEQLLIDYYGGPNSGQLLNKINGIGLTNPNRNAYLEAGKKLFEEVLKMIEGE